MNYSLKTNIFLLCLSLIKPIQITPLGDAEINQTEVNRYNDGTEENATRREADAKLGWFKRKFNNEAQRKYTNATEAQRQQALQDDATRKTYLDMDKDTSWLNMWTKSRSKDMIDSAKRVQKQKEKIQKLNEELSVDVTNKFYFKNDPLLTTITPTELQQLNPNSLQNLSYLVATKIININNNAETFLNEMNFEGKNFTQLNNKELVDILKTNEDTKSAVRNYAQATLNYRLNNLTAKQIQNYNIDDFLNHFTYATNISEDNQNIFKNKLEKELRQDWSDDFLITQYKKRIKELSQKNPKSKLIKTMIDTIWPTLKEEINRIATNLNISDTEIFNGTIDLNNPNTYNQIYKINSNKSVDLKTLKEYANFYKTYFKST